MLETSIATVGPSFTGWLVMIIGASITAGVPILIVCWDRFQKEEWEPRPDIKTQSGKPAYQSRKLVAPIGITLSLTAVIVGIGTLFIGANM